MSITIQVSDQSGLLYGLSWLIMAFGLGSVVHIIVLCLVKLNKLIFTDDPKIWMKRFIGVGKINRGNLLCCYAGSWLFILLIGRSGSVLCLIDLWLSRFTDICNICRPQL